MPARSARRWPASRRVLRVPTVELAVSLPYERLGAVKRLLHPPAIEILSERYGEGVELTLRVWAAERPRLEEALAELGLEARCEVTAPREAICRAWEG